MHKFLRTRKLQKTELSKGTFNAATGQNFALRTYSEIKDLWDLW